MDCLVNFVGEREAGAAAVVTDAAGRRVVHAGMAPTRSVHASVMRERRRRIRRRFASIVPVALQWQTVGENGGERRGQEHWRARRSARRRGERR